MRNSHKTTLRLLVTATAFAILFHRVDTDVVFTTLTTFPGRWIGALIVCLAAGLVISARKWQVVLGGMGREIALGTLIRISWIGQFFNTFLPGRTGGDLVRAYTLSRSDDTPIRSATSVVIDRGLNLLALVAIGTVAAVFETRLGDAATIPITAGAVALTGTALLHAKRARVIEMLPAALRQHVSQLSLSRFDRGRWVRVAALAVVYQLVMITMNVCGAIALSLDIEPAQLAVVIPVTALITALPISVNGLGVREAAYAAGLSAYGVPAESAIALSLALTAAIIGWNLIGGVLLGAGSLAGQRSDQTTGSLAG